jgi:hypothetical protein
MLRLLDRAAAGDELDEQNDQSQHQQDVNIGPDGVKAYETHQPQHQKNYKNRPEHVLILLASFSIDGFYRIVCEHRL